MNDNPTQEQVIEETLTKLRQALADMAIEIYELRELISEATMRELKLKQQVAKLEDGAQRLVRAQSRMLDDWAEDGDGPFTRTRIELWRELHAAGDDLRALLDTPHSHCEDCGTENIEVDGEPVLCWPCADKRAGDTPHSQEENKELQLCGHSILDKSVLGHCRACDFEIPNDQDITDD